MGHEMIVAEPQGLIPRLAEYHGKAVTLIAEVQAILGEQMTGRISSAEKYEKAGELNTALGELIRGMEAENKSVTAPVKSAIKKVDGMYDKDVDPMKKAKARLAGAIATKFSEDKAAEERRVEEANKKALKNFTARAERAEVAGREAPVPPDMQTAEVSKTVAGSGIREVWDFTVTDLHAVPEDFLRPREVNRARVLDELRALEKAGKPTVIKGLACKKVPSVAG